MIRHAKSGPRFLMRGCPASARGIRGTEVTCPHMGGEVGEPQRNEACFQSLAERHAWHPDCTTQAT